MSPDVHRSPRGKLATLLLLQHFNDGVSLGGSPFRNLLVAASQVTGRASTLHPAAGLGLGITTGDLLRIEEIPRAILREVWINVCLVDVGGLRIEGLRSIFSGHPPWIKRRRANLARKVCNDRLTNITKATSRGSLHGSRIRITVHWHPVAIWIGHQLRPPELIAPTVGAIEFVEFASQPVDELLLDSPAANHLLAVNDATIQGAASQNVWSLLADSVIGHAALLVWGQADFGRQIVRVENIALAANGIEGTGTVGLRQRNCSESILGHPSHQRPGEFLRTRERVRIVDSPDLHQRIKVTNVASGSASRRVCSTSCPPSGRKGRAAARSGVHGTVRRTVHVEVTKRGIPLHSTGIDNPTHPEQPLSVVLYGDSLGHICGRSALPRIANWIRLFSPLALGHPLLIPLALFDCSLILTRNLNVSVLDLDRAIRACGHLLPDSKARVVARLSERNPIRRINLRASRCALWLEVFDVRQVNVAQPANVTRFLNGPNGSQFLRRRINPVPDDLL